MRVINVIFYEISVIGGCVVVVRHHLAEKRLTGKDESTYLLFWFGFLELYRNSTHVY